MLFITVPDRQIPQCKMTSPGMSAVENLKEALTIAADGCDFTPATSSLIAWEERLKSINVGDCDNGITHSEVELLKEVLQSQLVPLLKSSKSLHLPNELVVRGVEIVKQCVIPAPTAQKRQTLNGDSEIVNEYNIQFASVLALKQLGLVLFTGQEASKVS